jgi:hypothetical protein
MDVFKSEPDSDSEVYPVSFQGDFEFVDMRQPPTAWKEVKVSCG